MQLKNMISAVNSSRVGGTKAFCFKGKIFGCGTIHAENVAEGAFSSREGVNVSSTKAEGASPSQGFLDTIKCGSCKDNANM